MASPSRKLQRASTTTNWLIECGQVWKLYVALAGFGITLLCFLLGAFLLITGIQSFFTFMAYGTLLGIITLAWMFNVLRCPHCQTRIAWTMIKSCSHTSWLLDLVALQACPRCHHRLVSS